jgi:uncharacterized protein (TIGR03083 family)
VDVEEHVAALERDGALLAEAAQRAGLTAEVPPCPGWQVRDLVRHVAYVHGWAARHVSERRENLIGEASEADILGGGPQDSELIAAYREGHANLVRTLREADAGIACATFLPAPSPLAFWARRQAYETAIHRFDAELAAAGTATTTATTAGGPSPLDAFDPAFADDGVDELVMGFAARRRYQPGGAPQTLSIRATDTAGRWHVRLADGRIRAQRGEHPAEADCVLDGPAAGLYILLWNRGDSAQASVTVSGDPGTSDIWGSHVRVRW